MAIWFFAYLCNSFAFCLFLLYLKEQDIGTSKENSFTSEIVFYDSGLMLGLVTRFSISIVLKKVILVKICPIFDEYH